MITDRRLHDPVVIGPPCILAPTAVGFPPIFRRQFYLLRRLVCWRRGHVYLLKDEAHIECARCGCFWFALGGRFVERTDAAWLARRKQWQR